MPESTNSQRPISVIIFPDEHLMSLLLMKPKRSGGKEGEVDEGDFGWLKEMLRRRCKQGKVMKGRDNVLWVSG